MVRLIRSMWAQGVALTAATVVPMIAAAQGVKSVPTDSQAAISDRQVEGLGVGLFTGDLFDLIANIINGVLLIAGIVALAYLIYGGFKYITAGGNAEGATEGRTAITNAIIGVILIVASLAILGFVRGRLSGR